LNLLNKEIVMFWNVLDHIAFISLLWISVFVIIGLLGGIGGWIRKDKGIR